MDYNMLSAFVVATLIVVGAPSILYGMYMTNLKYLCIGLACILCIPVLALVMIGLNLTGNCG